jgi:hypothetical protein
MDVQNTPVAASTKSRRTWPAVVLGAGVLGAATLTLTLLSPLGTSSAGASELTAFDDCDAVARHMSGLAMDRILDSRRAYDEYSEGDAEDDPVFRDGGDRAVPPMPAPEVAAGTTGTSGVAAGTGAAAVPGAATDAGTAAAPAAAAAKSASDGSDAVGNSASGTNTQEAGVDEADLAKTDGRLLVTARDRRLVVMDVSGDRPKARGSVVLPGQRALELLLAGDRAIVVGTADSRVRYLDDERSASGRGTSELTTLSIVDLSDPDRPRIVSSEEISARYLSARMTGGTVRMVFASTPDVIGNLDRDRYYDGPSRFDDEFIDDTRARLARIPGEDWLPIRRDVDRDARTVDEAPLLDCSDVRYPVTDSGMDLLTVLSIDTGVVDALEQAAATGLIGSGELVYATQDKLFVATTDGGWFDSSRNGDRWLNEPARRDGRVSTRVHSFDITGPDVEYLASGRVDGYLYGRWAMSEKDGLLRMVTTTTAPWNRNGNTQTGVVVLDTAGKRMREVGRVDGMGFTETVRSVRWFDDVAAIVTFRQTDPLYLVDLSRPESPKVRGELKIPGFSSYLHPIGDHRLLGIGQDANEWGGTLGLQISSFDILDLADPQRTDNLTFGRNSSSPVERDPRGFVYLPNRSLAVLPVLNDTFDAGRGEQGYRGNGLVAVRVTKDGELREIADWYAEDSRRIVKLIPLPDGRLVGLDYRGIRLFDLETLEELGSAYYG